MTGPRIGSLFSGYEGIGLALAAVFGEVEHVFVSDVCKHVKTKDGRYEVGHYEPHRSPCSILAHRFPGVPNLGDVSLIDWTPWRGLIDILTAGFPCTDVSVAGGRAGLRDGTRTGLWSQVVRAITELQPRLVVLENVPGIFTAPAAGQVEPCPVCLGERPGEHLRALDAVLADLAEIGFDADWTVVPASGVGAAHKRERWFCAAYPAGQPWSFEHGDSGATADADGEQLQGVGSLSRLGGDLSHAVMCDDCSGRGEVVTLLPTPAVNDMGAAYTPETWDEWTTTMKAKHNNGNGHGKSLNVEAQRLLPTPTTRDTKDENQRQDDTCLTGALLPTPRASDGAKGGPNQRGSSGDLMLPSAVSRMLPTPTAKDAAQSGGSSPSDVTLADAVVRTELGTKDNPCHAVNLLPTPAVADAQGGRKARSGDRSDELLLNGIAAEARWGEYEPAIRRWEAVTRPAPEPTKLNAKGNPKLSDEFDEWHMGLPAGWITDVPGVTWNEALKACGNGVVPQQAAAALRFLLGAMEAAA